MPLDNLLEKVKQLREITGVGFKDCKNAIDETKGDIEKSIELLRKKGIAKASKRMGKVAAEGLVCIYEKANNFSMIEINCETDFVAKNSDFINFVKELSELNNQCNSNVEKLKNSKMQNGKIVNENLVALIAKIGEKITIGRTKTISHPGTKNFTYHHTVVKDNLSKLAVVASLETKEKSKNLDLFGKQLTMHIAASNPLALNSEGIKKEILEKEQELISKELKNLGKPEEIAKKISIGKLNKFKEENSLLSQPWVMEPKRKVKDVMNDLKISDLKIKDFYRLKIGE